MKNIKYFSLILLCILSFYISDRAILYVENISPLMKEIKSVSSNFETLPIDATIMDDKIITGVSGLIVNERESYLKMNEFGVFNENFLVYDYVKPKVSYEDNSNKIIVGSNRLDSVALIIDDWKFLNILEDINFSYIMVNLSNYKDLDNVEYINGGTSSYESIEKFLKRKNINKNIILSEFNDLNFKGKKIVSPSIEIYSSNLAYQLSNIKGGSIIYLHDNLSVTEAKLVINKIKQKNLSIMKLSKFISE